MLLMLHTHVVGAANTILELNPVQFVQELAKLIIVNFTRFPTCQPADYTLSRRQKTQLLWSHCVNTRGYPGNNIPCDLHMEHLNRRVKNIILGMGTNVNAATIQKAGKIPAPVYRICQVFEQQTVSRKHSDHHPIPAFGKDFTKVLEVFEQERVFLATFSQATQFFQVHLWANREIFL